jgi:hypothetical protein
VEQSPIENPSPQKAEVHCLNEIGADEVSHVIIAGRAQLLPPTALLLILMRQPQNQVLE